MRSHSKFQTSFLRCKKGEPINWSAGRHLSPNLNRLLGQSLIFSSSLWGGKKFCSITNPHLIFETCLRHFWICSLRYDKDRSMKIGWITRSSWTIFLTDSLSSRARVAGLDRLSAGTKMAMKPFVKRVFTIFATNASFLRVISNFRI